MITLKNNNLGLTVFLVSMVVVIALPPIIAAWLIAKYLEAPWWITAMCWALSQFYNMRQLKLAPTLKVE